MRVANAATASLRANPQKRRDQGNRIMSAMISPLWRLKKTGKRHGPAFGEEQFQDNL
jgi:hypothetical protein